MRPLTLQEMIVAMGGRLYGEITIPRVIGVSTDSRQVRSGDLFFAIRGEHYDGHAFVNEALEKGATAAVVERLNDVAPAFQTCGRIIHVPDTVAALGRVAGWYRRQFAAQVVAVVGSNGKTTTKDMVAAVLSTQKRGRKAPASFNNAIGVPLTLLAVEPADEFVVVEIGTNHPGEVAALGRMAMPDQAVVTAIGEEHLEFFGDVEAVAREEFSILSCLDRRGFAVVNRQAAEFAPNKALDGCTVLTYGFDEPADLRATDLTPDAAGYRFRVNGRFDYRLPVWGRHNVANALAAIAVGTRFRLAPEAIARGLETVKLPPMRLERRVIGSVTVINDAYNANPSSMRATFAAMDEIEGVERKVLILGDMRELGDAAARCHQEIGREAGRSTAQVIIAVGAFSRVVGDGATLAAGTRKRIYTYPTVEAAADKLGELVQAGDLVLLKGSRAVRLERLVEPIEQAVLTSPAA